MDDKSWGGPGYASALLQGLDALRRRGLTTDVVLLAGGRQFPAHRAVLASCSGYFYSAFVEGRCGDPQLVSLPGVTCEALAALLDFMYAGELPRRAVATAAVSRDLVAAARHLRVHGVAQACARLLKESLLDPPDLKPSKEDQGANLYAHHLQQFIYSLHNTTSSSSPSSSSSLSSSSSSPPSSTPSPFSVYSHLGDPYQFNAFSPFFHRAAVAGYKLSPFCYAGPRGAEPLWWPLAARGACSQHHQQQQWDSHTAVKSEGADANGARSPAGPVGEAEEGDRGEHDLQRVIDMSVGGEQRRQREDTMSPRRQPGVPGAAEAPEGPARRDGDGGAAREPSDGAGQAAAVAGQQERAPCSYWKKHKLRSCMALISREDRDGSEDAGGRDGEGPLAGNGGEARGGTGRQRDGEEVVEEGGAAPSGGANGSCSPYPCLLRREEYVSTAAAAVTAQERRSCEEMSEAGTGPRGEQRVYRCDTCDAEFRHKGNLTSHRAVHTGEKPYPCDVCGARFNRPANLKTHARIHSGEKPYRCDSCGARFVQVAHLRAHVLIHTGEKPYPCATCGTRFRHLQTLKSHIRIHTGEKPYHCETCNVHFRHKSQLRLHMRQKHGAVTNTKTRYGLLPPPPPPPSCSLPPA
ncbi:B-cell CLL/lymphoma 6 member B protein-like isoform X1 [Lethenteron reissneri]|uniref:B-cell CLL/lymphoma 6 member B protein-like isoform X1 n=1 Tax=Lethenteron reissneri TaxID=7753 RepID=UPI002AB7B162|nr:B-cell CLL/lymphoma 6 member B protein-like isoform X1 [Lethenteron reissneri]